MKHLLFASIIFIIACGGPSTPMTIDQIAEKHSWAVGKINSAYRYDPKHSYTDGSYIVTNFIDIINKKFYIDADNIANENCIVLRMVGSPPLINYAVKEHSFFNAFDEYGIEFSPKDIIVKQSNEEYIVDIIIKFEEDISKAKFVSTGPYNRDDYGSTIIVFPIISY